MKLLRMWVYYVLLVLLNHCIRQRLWEVLEHNRVHESIYKINDDYYYTKMQMEEIEVMYVHV